MSRQYVIKKLSDVDIRELDNTVTHVRFVEDLIFEESQLTEVFRCECCDELTYKFRGMEHEYKSMYVQGEFVQIKSVQNTPEKQSSESTDFKGSGYSRMGVQ